jgi:protein SCO1
MSNFLPTGATLQFATIFLTSTIGALTAETFTGSVVSVTEDRQALVVEAEDRETPVTVDVGPGDYAIARPGWKIRGELVPYAGRRLLQTIMPNDPQEKALIQRLDRQLQQNTLNRGSGAFRSMGERIPRFALWKQDGALFHSDSLRGNYAVINFIFTRCKSPTMCPAATQRMAQLQDMAKEQGITDLRQVSITLDPEFDTPGVFFSYAEGYGIDHETFFFLSGPARVVENLKTQLGVLAEPDEEEIIRHTLATALIDPSGEIIYRIPGSQWDPAIFLQQIEKHRNAQTASAQ